MKAVLYDAAHSYKVTEVPTPEPGPGEVRIRVIQTGVCGTDLHIDAGEFGAVFPLIPGHEVVGVVDKVGAGVTRVRVGEQVSVNPNVDCLQCDYCRSGRPILCPNLRGYGCQVNGFFAEYALAAERLVYSTEGLDPDTAVFTEPASCATHGTDNLRIRPGQTALVFGAGPTGLLLSQLIKASGAASVTVAAPKQFKLDVAKGLGIDQTVLIDRKDMAGAQRAAMAASGGRGYDIVVEATGSSAVGNICVPLTRNGGTVLIYGVTSDHETVTFHPFDVFRREITIRGSFAEMTSFEAAISALRSGRVRTDGMISHRFSIDEYGKALETLRSDPTAHKVIIVA